MSVMRHGAQILKVTTYDQERTTLNIQNHFMNTRKKSLQEENVSDTQAQKKMLQVCQFLNGNELLEDEDVLRNVRQVALHQRCSMLTYQYPRICINTTEKQTERQLKCLAFQNPGPLLADFNPEIRLQKKEIRRTKLRQLVFENNAVGQRKYDNAGRLLLNGTDLCDCLDENCSGCFYACSKCSSWKCGSKCRCNRKWIYDGIETEGSDIVQNFLNLDSN